MKNSMILLLTFLLAGAQLFGQERGHQAQNPEIRIQKLIDGFSETVTITDSQKAAMKKVLLNHQQERKALGRDATREQRSDLQAKKSAEMQKALGNSETYQAYRAYVKENRQKQMQNRKKQGARKGEGMRKHKHQNGEGRRGQGG